jgi:hypothetical protein
MNIGFVGLSRMGGLSIPSTSDEAEAGPWMDDEHLIKRGLHTYDLRQWELREGRVTVALSLSHVVATSSARSASPVPQLLLDLWRTGFLDVETGLRGLFEVTWNDYVALCLPGGCCKYEPAVGLHDHVSCTGMRQPSPVLSRN